MSTQYVNEWVWPAPWLALLLLHLVIVHPASPFAGLGAPALSLRQTSGATHLDCFPPDLSRMLAVLLAVVLGLAAASPTRRSVDSGDDLISIDRSAPDSLNDMLREVEQLTEDTRSKLESAIKEINAEEISADRVNVKDLPPNYHNESIIETKVGNDTIITKQEIVKKTDNKTGSTFFSETIVSSLNSGDRRAHECIVDEDCGLEGFCSLTDFNYKCLPCKDEDTALCSRDGECCRDQICVWGQCKKSIKGDSGSICESQQDCAPGLCCAVHASLLFPVCTPLPVKGEECQTPNPLLDLLTWSLEPEAPSNYCPCASGLVCQPQSYNSVSICEEPSEQNKRDHLPELPSFTAMPQEDIFYEEGEITPTGFGIDPRPSEDERDVEFISEPHFVDYI